MEVINYYKFEILLLLALLLPIITLFCDFVFLIKHLKNERFSLIRFKNKVIFLLINIFSLTTFVVLFSYLFISKPQVIATYPESEDTLEGYDKPITVIFDRPINKDKLSFNISPEVEGDIIFTSYLPFTNPRVVEFHPENSFLPEEKIMIYLSYISNAFNPDPGHEYLFEFFSQELPSLENSSIDENITNVPVTQSIALEYKGSISQCDWEVLVEPEIETELQLINGEEKILIDFPNGLQQSSSYTLEIFQIPQVFEIDTGQVVKQLDKKLVKKFSFETVKAPLISSINPNGLNILPDKDIVIEFDQSMIPESVINNLKITPDIETNFNWNENNSKLIIEVDLSIDTEYSITLQSGTLSSAGGIIEDDFIHNFKTIGDVEVSSIDPVNRSTGVQVNRSITINFNQPVDFDTTKSKLSLYPENQPLNKVSGQITGNQYSLSFKPDTNLNYSTKYIVKLDKNVQSIYGSNSRTDFFFEFTTVNQISLINVTWDGQDVNYTCNFAATKMALAAKGVSVSETDLINLAGRQPDFNFYNMTGGNPHKGFVNYYGTYWEPISRAVSNYRNNMVKSGWTLSEVCSEIQKGNPIVTWGQNGWSTDTPRNWVATDGEYITGFSGMHSVTIVGCEGNPTNPTYIYIQDPWRKWGNKLTASEMLRRWSYFGNTGMVVY